MYFLNLYGPGAGLPFLIIVILAIIIIIPILAYRAGFKNGKREGERIQLQKQIDKIEH